jgi:hypothetical protein
VRGAVDGASPLTSFSERFYEWARAEWQHELANGCERLRTVPSRTLNRVGERLGEMAPGDQAAAAEALVKRAHEDAVAARGERISPRERALVETLLRRPLQVPPAAAPIDRTLLRRRVREELMAVTGVPPDRSFATGAVWRHVQAIGVAHLFTYVDTGGRPRRQVEYDHAVLVDGSEVKSGISLGSWLGISTTRFDSVVPGMEDAAATVVGRLVAHFASALPGLCS